MRQVSRSTKYIYISQSHSRQSVTVRQVRTWKICRDWTLVTRQVVRSKVSSYAWCSKSCASVFKGMYISGATNGCDSGRSFSGFLTFLLSHLLRLLGTAIGLSRSLYLRKKTRTACPYVHSPPWDSNPHSPPFIQLAIANKSRGIWLKEYCWFVSESQPESKGKVSRSTRTCAQ